MPSTLLKKQAPPLGPEANGMLMTPAEFDRADFSDDWRFELVNEALIVSPLPSVSEVDPNEELGYLLRHYKEYHPQGFHLDATLPERLVKTGRNRRRADRLIWAELGRLPKKNELPTIVVEIVSRRKRDRLRDYEDKRVEYLRVGVKECWVLDRFQRCLTVFTKQGGRKGKRVVTEKQRFTSELLPGFELPLERLFRLAEQWQAEEED